MSKNPQIMAMSRSYVDIDKTAIKQLSARSDFWGAWLTFHVWAVIIGAGALFVFWPNIITYLLAVWIIGTRQHGMAILMHDAAHGILFKNKRLNDFAGKWFLGAPYGGELEHYRKYHLVHHRYAQTDKDPDLSLSAKFPVTSDSLKRKFFRDLTGLTFLRIRIAAIQMARGKLKPMEGMDAFENTSSGPYLITNIIMFAILWALGVWWAYFGLWLLPLMTVFWAVLRLRNISEHAMTENSENPLRHARTTKSNIFTRAFLAVYWVNYHVEHHAYMYVPCYNLPKLHKLFVEGGYGETMELRNGYRDVLKLVVQPSS